jgi:hypothetical protein
VEDGDANWKEEKAPLAAAVDSTKHKIHTDESGFEGRRDVSLRDRMTLDNGAGRLAKC